MASPELEQLIAALRAGGPDLGAPPAQARSDFSAMAAAAPVAPDLHFEEVTLGGVAALGSRSPGARTERVLLYLHGGAFVVGSAADYRSLSGELGRAAGIQCLSVNYRLAPEHPFPAAVEDALAAYRALLDSGTPAARVVVAGDSAGAGLAVSLLLAARDAGVPLPAGAVLMSPWVDLACSGETMTTKAAADPALQRQSLLVMAQRYLAGAPAASPLASPLRADLAGLPPLLIQVGSAEILLDDAVRLAGKLAAADVRVQLSTWPHMPHVWHFFSFMLAQGRQALQEAGDFLRARLGS